MKTLQTFLTEATSLQESTDAGLVITFDNPKSMFKFHERSQMSDFKYFCPMAIAKSCQAFVETSDDFNHAKEEMIKFMKKIRVAYKDISPSGYKEYKRKNGKIW